MVEVRAKLDRRGWRTGGGKPEASGTVEATLFGTVEVASRGVRVVRVTLVPGGTFGKRPFTRNVRFLLTYLWIPPSAKAYPAVDPADRFGSGGSWL